MRRRGKASRCAPWFSFRRLTEAALPTGRLALNAFGARRPASKHTTKGTLGRSRQPSASRTTSSAEGGTAVSTIDLLGNQAALRRLRRTLHAPAHLDQRSQRGGVS